MTNEELLDFIAEFLNNTQEDAKVKYTLRSLWSSGVSNEEIRDTMIYIRDIKGVPISNWHFGIGLVPFNLKECERWLTTKQEREERIRALVGLSGEYVTNESNIEVVKVSIKKKPKGLINIEDL